MEWFRSSSNYAKRGTVDREKGAIFGVSVNTVGEAKGHGVHLEQSFVDRVAELGNAEKNGLKARFGHPSMCSTALGTMLGRFRNFRVEGEQVIADLFLSNSAKETPNGNLYDYVLGLAESESDMFGTSIVFTIGEEYQNDGDEKTFVTCEKLHACDVVDDPAANPDGLFSAFNQEALSAQVSEFLGTHPEVYEILSSKPEIVEQFMKNYDQYKSRTKESEMAEEKEVVEELEVAESIEVVELESEVVEEVAESIEEVAELEAIEEEVVVEEPTEEIAEEKELESVNPVEAFQAIADEHGYEFAKANYEKSEVEILKAVIAQKNEELSKKEDGIEAVEFSDGEAKQKLSYVEAMTQKLSK
ncbi:MAG: hypothetical protein GY750_21015 [Lentisphaerae bacterium]|nr:hypothetical protein [Lentisphaerota bacterium]